MTLNPPNLVKFKITDEEQNKEDMEPSMRKANAYIEIINKSHSHVLFKVKTTNI